MIQLPSTWKMFINHRHYNNYKYAYEMKNNNFAIAVNYSAYTLFTYAQLYRKYALKLKTNYKRERVY